MRTSLGLLLMALIFVGISGCGSNGGELPQPIGGEAPPEVPETTFSPDDPR